MSLVIRRRCWDNVSTNGIITREWNLVSDGTRMTKELDFFKEAFVR